MKQEKEVELLSKKVAIENRDLKEEFDAHIELYKTQLNDARQTIANHRNSSSYSLRYDPPKIVTENGKKVVKAGYVNLSLRR